MLGLHLKWSIKVTDLNVNVVLSASLSEETRLISLLKRLYIKFIYFALAPENSLNKRTRVWNVSLLLIEDHPNFKSKSFIKSPVVCIH